MEEDKSIDEYLNEMFPPEFWIKLALSYEERINDKKDDF